ncbi:hypothetical protein LC724_32405 [Blautia sp. RD014234]|nr:hypothetical protein [Blautia parvula]
MEEQRPHVLQWHPAFYAGIQIELETEANTLLFENEHQLGTKPKEIDVLIIKRKRGDKIPMQLILTKELSETQNLWLKSLTDELEEIETVKHLLEQYGKHKGNILYKSVMNLIVRANQEKFKEVKTMCEALEELMKDEMEAKRTEGKADAVLELLLSLGSVSEQLRKVIMEQKNTAILNTWLIYAARAESIADFEQKIKNDSFTAKANPH